MTQYTYTIIVLNQSGKSRNYTLCSDESDPFKLAGSPESTSFVKGSSPDGTTVTITISKQYYAVTGSSGRVTDWSPATIARKGESGNHFQMEGESREYSAIFDPSKTKMDCVEPGAFSITCKGDFSLDQGHFVGAGTQDHKDHRVIIPFIKFPAEPLSTINIHPGPKFTLSYTEFTVGTGINVETSPTGVKIDFSRDDGRNRFSATVAHTGDIVWDLKYA